MNGATHVRNQHNEELYQTAMSVYEVENSQNENKAQRELNNTNIDNLSLNTDFNSEGASMKVIEQDKVAAIVPKPKDGIYELCSARKDKLLPFLNNNTLLFEKLARSFAWEINTNDKLRACSQLSIVNAFYKCCEYGLDPASSLGQAWLISYKSNIDLQIGYRGWLKLLLNNPLVSNVYSYGVYKDDFFEYELGMNPNIKHVPSKEKQHKDNLIATYGVVKLKSGEAQIKVCFRDEINESMESSRSSHKPDSPWVTHFEAMALVVPIRKLGKNLGLPLKIEGYDESVNYEIKNI
jgi:recombination protein RecT